MKDNEITALRKQTEREFLEKIKIEDNIMEKMRSQLTLDKAAQYTKKMTDKLRRRATELVGIYSVGFLLDNPVTVLDNPDCLDFYASWNKNKKKDQNVPFIIPRPFCEFSLFVCVLNDHVLILPETSSEMERTS